MPLTCPMLSARLLCAKLVLNRLAFRSMAVEEVLERVERHREETESGRKRRRAVRRRTVVGIIVAIEFRVVG